MSHSKSPPMTSLRERIWSEWERVVNTGELHRYDVFVETLIDDVCEHYSLTQAILAPVGRGDEEVTDAQALDAHDAWARENLEETQARLKSLGVEVGK